MEVSFKFNSGETGQEMVAAILALFGAAPAAARITQTVISPADNPATGADGDDAGPAHTGAYDTEGSPWDAAIHSDKKTVTDKGVWRKRKGVPPQQVAAKQAELKAAGKYATAAPAAAPVAPTTPAGLPGLPGLPATQPAGLPGLPALAPVETPYQKLVGFVAANMNSPANPAGRFTQEWISASLAQYGFKDPAGNGSLQALESAAPENVAAVHAAFAQALGVAV